MKTKCLFLLAFFSSASLYSEIEQVVITWNPVSCTEKCAELIEKRFHNMKQVQEANINAATGVATLRWNKASPFSYRLVKTQMQMVGVGVNDIRVRVRGNVKEEGKDVALYSAQDNTRFVLVSPIIPELGKQTVYPNPYFRELNPSLKDRILLEAQENKILVIEGPLYQPARSPPLQIVIERIQVEKKDQKKG